MNKCLAPCNQACTPAGAAAYAAEAAAVEAFFATHGESLLAQLTAEREQASTGLDFERAAQLHAQFLRVKSAAALADPLVQPIPNLRAVILQKAVAEPRNPDPVILSEARSAESKDLRFAGPDTEAEPSAAIFLIEAGSLVGPARLASAGQTDSATASDPAVPPTPNPEERVTELLADLAARAKPHPKSAPDLATLSDHLSLLRRWYYRPEKQRVGEVFFPREGATDKPSWPIRRILNAAARISLGDTKPTAEAQHQPPQSPDEAVH
jgi:hypothetical protein